MSKLLTGLVLAFALAVVGATAHAQPVPGSILPPFEAVDIFNRPVDLEALSQEGRDLVILFFFSTSVGDDIALRLRALDMRIGRERLYIAAIGLREDEDALKAFAEKLDIDYFVIPDGPDVAADQKYGPFAILPLTFIASNDRTLLKIVAGAGEDRAGLINYIAQNFLRRGQADEAKAAAETAIEVGEDEKAARETTGFAFVAEGKLDEAEAAFKQIDSVSGQAAVELERGNFDKAVALAREAEASEGYASTVLGVANMRMGKLDEAEKAFGRAVAKDDMADWQKSEAYNGAGRIAQENGNLDAAIEQYKQAGSLDFYNIAALSNEGAAHREQGSLESAQTTLERAQRVAADINRNDELITMMLRQVNDQLARANDLQRLEFIREQIKDLAERYRQLQAEGRAEPVDDWTSRPMVVAFLEPDASSGVFFERAGTPLTLKREVEMRLARNGRINVVERDKLELLLQELNLGSSELADENTQLRLGRVLAARELGFIDFGYLGQSPRMNLRMVDTETTRIATQFSKEVNPQGDLDALVEEIVAELENKLVAGVQLQGRIAEATDPEAVLINLGTNHGVEPGMRFAAVADGEPITVGGRTIPGRPILAGTLEVTEVINEDLSVCKVVDTRDGAELAPEVKIKQLGD